MKLDGWVETCNVDEIVREDVIRFDFDDRTFAIYRTAKDEYFATDGYCTHQRIHLADGLVMGNLIECPKHNGRFDITTGQAKRPPVCIDLHTYPVKITAGKVYLKVD